MAGSKWAKVNLNSLYVEAVGGLPPDDSPALDPKWCEEMMAKLHADLGVDLTYGGYMEDRTDLWSGSYLTLRHEKTPIIHLGVDYNVPEGSPVYLPAESKLILLEADGDQEGGWGGRAIYRSLTPYDGDRHLYTIYAHLHKLEGRVGEVRGKGEVVGVVAPVEKNGGWYPHLHVQCMFDYTPFVDGYGPAEHRDLFPDPEKCFE